MEIIQKVSHLHNGIFHSMSNFFNFTLSLSLCYSLKSVDCTLSLSMCYSLKIRKYKMGEKSIFCIYGWFSASGQLYQGRQKITSLGTIEFFDTYVCISKLQRKVHRRTCIRDINLFDCTSSFLCNFWLLSSSTPCPYSSDVLTEWPL